MKQEKTMFGIRKRFKKATPPAQIEANTPVSTAASTGSDHSLPAASAAEPRIPRPEEYIRGYDYLITSPLIRRYYGSDPFFNVGYWTKETTSQAEASRQLLDRLLSHAPTCQTAILDVGCGLGATTAQIKRRWPDAQVTGINISEKQIAECRSNAPNCDFRCMDATHLEFAEASFDLIVCVEAAFHFNTRRDFMQEAYRVLKPGGMLLLADLILDVTRLPTIQHEGAVVDAISIWPVTQSNALPSLKAYEHDLAELGYQNILTEDITAQSWTCWCRNIVAWIEQEHQRGTVTLEELKVWQTGSPAFSASVLHYFLAVTCKP